MKSVNQAAELRVLLADIRKSGQSVGFVPTMGNLHAGHLKLVESAATHCDKVIVSIFVNPMQFGEAADLKAYPNTPDEDEKLLSEHDVDILYRPTLAEVYPFGLDKQTRITVPGISEMLEGRARPDHFIGVATVVNRFFNQINPNAAFFGKKDYQQYLLIRKMVRDLAMNIKVVGVDTVRHENGLAMSSRNSHLTKKQFSTATVLQRTLEEIASKYSIEMTPPQVASLEEEGIQQLKRSGLEPDYLSIRRQVDLGVPESGDVNLVALIAARLGSTRLIDNLEFNH